MSKLLIPIALIAASIALFFGLTQPLMGDIETLGATQTELNSGLDNAAKLKRIGGDLQSKFNAITQGDKDRLNKLVPDSIDNVRFIIDINNLASKYNMTLRNIKVRADDGTTSGKLGPQTKKYGTVVLGFTVSGSYGSLRQFLNDMETSLRLVDVTSVSFLSSDKDSNEYSFEIKTYWLK